MTELFLKFVNMSISAGWLVLAVICVRLLFRKAPKWLNPVLWGIVALRLLLPFSIESALSLIPSAETISPEIMYAQEPTIYSGIAALNSVVNPILTESFAPETSSGVNPLQICLPIMSIVWLIGILAMLGYAVISYLRLYKRVKTAVLLRDNIYQSEHADTPFVLGILRPHIYLPFDMAEKDTAHVIAHEQTHIRRKDHWWKPIGFLLLSLYWFNPVLWAAYILLCRDIELACDERVIRELGTEQRADYSEALLSCSVSHKTIAACPLAFGEAGVKERVKNILNYKKPAFWVIAAAVIASIVLAVCFLTNPYAPYDALTFAGQETVGRSYSADFEVKLGNSVKSGSVAAEQWYNGECVKSSPVVLTQHAEEIHIRMDVGQGGALSSGVQIDIDTDEYGASLLTRFEFPEKESLTGWSFKSYVQGDEIRLAPDEEVILAAMAFDAGEGVRVFDCETLTNEPERLKEAGYMIVVRAVFDDSALGIQNEAAVPAPAEALRLSDVIRLSQKGDELTWADFEDYDYTDIGSGLFICVYEIDEMFSLRITGGSREGKPMYIMLQANDGSEESIDIRRGNVEKFIDAHKDRPFVKKCSFNWQCSPVGYSEETFQKMIEIGGLPPNAMMSSIQSLPTVRIGSTEELDSFLEKMNDTLYDTFTYSDVPAFSDMIKAYDKEFFASNTLILVYLTEPTTAHRHSVEYVRKSEGTLSIGIRRIEPESGDTAMEGWMIGVTVPTEQITDAAKIDARVSSIEFFESGAINKEMVRLYLFSDSEQVMKPSIALFDDGRFSFNFSVISSYLGIGKYEINDDRLTLRTDDGNHVYVFDMAEDTLIFDADASSKQLWFSGLYDGAVFK